MPSCLFVVCWVRAGERLANDVALFSSRERALAAVRARVSLSDPRLGVLESQGAYVRTDGVIVGYLLRKEVDEGRAGGAEVPVAPPPGEGEGILSSREVKARCGGSCHACGERYESGSPIVSVVLYRLDSGERREVRCHQACPGKG